MMMKTTISKTASNATAPLAIDVKLNDLSALRRRVIEEIVSLEKMGAVPVDPQAVGHDDVRAAHDLLNGSAYAPAPKVQNAGTQLFSLRRQIEVIDRAIEIGQEQSTRANADRAKELAAQHQPEWRALQRKRALALVSLIEANRSIETLKEKLFSGSVSPLLELDGFSVRLFGAAIEPETVLNTWPRRFLKEAVALGIIKQTEMPK